MKSYCNKRKMQMVAGLTLGNSGQGCIRDELPAYSLKQLSGERRLVP